MQTTTKHTIFAILLLILIGCNKTADRQEPELNFYHWSQEVKLTKEQNALLKQVNAKKLYVRFFDVHWSSSQYAEFDAPIPESVTKFTNLPKNIETVPAVYVKNDVMKNLSGNQIGQKDLAKRIAKKITNMASEQQIEIKKIQMDCDWTQGTKTAYFQFLTYLKKELQPNQTLSATIRLHQVKYANKTGIPPVDEGALMLYNVGDVRSRTEINSIFNQTTIKQYLSGFDNYSLPLNIALPSFSWGVVYTNYGVYPRIDMLQKDVDTMQTKSLGQNQYVIQKYNDNYYLSKGDTIRIEQPNGADIDWAIKTFAKKIKKMPEQPEIIFYNIESEFTKQELPNILTEIK